MIDIVNPNVEYIEDTDILKLIEKAGRTCYKSEDKITEDSAEKFVKMICKNHHTSVLEHGTVYLEDIDDFNESDYKQTCEYCLLKRIEKSPYSTCITDAYGNRFITTNFRVLVENLDGNYDLAIEFYKKHNRINCDHEPRFTFRITCDRGVSHELVRHRVFSFSQESTRYVKYNNSNFKFIKPAWWNDSCNEMREIFINSCEECAKNYTKLIEMGQTPQQARAVLPNALKTEVVMTGTLAQWEQFLKLRDTNSAHPDMQIIARKIKDKLNEIRHSI